MIEVVVSCRVSLLAFYSSEKVLSAQVCSLAYVSITVLWLKTRIKLVFAKVNTSGHVKKVIITTNNRIQACFNSSRRKKAKHWTQNQLTNRMYNYQKNTNLFGNVQNFLFHLRLTEWSVFTLTLVVLNPKVIFKWRKDNNKNKKNPLQGAKVRTSCISFSLSQNSHRTTQTNAGDKGCAEACAERFSALKDQHWRHVVSSLSRGHFRNVFVKFLEMLGFWSFIFL